MSHDPLFHAALDFLFPHEGGLVDDPDDPGGITNYGVSLRWLAKAGLLDLDGDGHADGDINLDGDIDADDIRALSREDAGTLYRGHWWDRHRYGDLPPAIAVKTLDLSVNMGARQAHRCLQRAVRACWWPLTDDGLIGPKTRSAIGAAPPEPLLSAFCSEAAGFYRQLVATNARRAKYLDGWLNRAYARPTVRLEAIPG